MTVANRSTAPLDVTVTPRPWVQAVTGKVSPNRRSTLPGVSVSQTKFTLQPGAETVVTANLTSAPSAGYLYGAMEVVGVGWTAQVMGSKLKLVVGFANPIMLDIPQGLKVAVDKSFVKMNGPDKRIVGQFAAQMRAVRKPEPYNGKGIKYVSEVIKKKAGKTFSA